MSPAWSQTVHEIADGHWIVITRNQATGHDVREIHAGHGSHTLHERLNRLEAELLGAAYTATRTHSITTSREA